MKASFLLTAVVGLGAIAVAMFYRHDNSKLKQELDDLKAARQASLSPSPEGPRTSRQNPKDPTRTDSPGSFEELITIQDPSDRIAALLQFAEGLSPDQIPETIEEIRRDAPHWDPEAKMLAHILLTRWAIDDPEGALASLKGIDLLKYGADPVSVLSGVSSENPDIAIAWLDDPSNSMVRLPFMGQVLAGSIAKEWVRLDSEAALAWARGLPESQKAGALTGVLGSLASSNPNKAAELAMKLGPGGSREHIIGEIADSWARQSPQEALAWAKGLEGKERDRAVKGSLGQWAGTDARGAAAFVDSMEPEEKASFLQSVSSPWSREDPAEAADWVMEVSSEPESREAAGRALGEVLWQWTTQDPEAAGTWLNNQEQGPQLDGAITGLAGAAFDEDPEASLSWATKISNEDLRNLSVNVGLGAWIQRDREAAAAWAEANEIPLPGNNPEE